MNINLKDSKQKSSVPYKIVSTGMSFTGYSKTNKLITALYMVTDIIEKEEPIRNKLRNLGAEIISDMHLIQQNNVGHVESTNACNRISETVSFLNIASAMNFISEMNYTILKKEFLELKGSIQEYIDMKPLWMAEFFTEPLSVDKDSVEDRNSKIATSPLERYKRHFKGHTRIGVQKGSTLLKAIKDMSDKITDVERQEFGRSTSVSSKAQDFSVVKNQRRDDIINSIKDNGGSATITDIKNKSKGHLFSCSEKTLQRELMSMIKDGVLNKTGEKRWSRYVIRG